MDFNIIKRTEEPLLDRRSIEFEIINTERTLKLLDVRIGLAKKLNLKPESLVVRNIRTIYGNTSQQGLAFYYKSSKALKQLEHMSRLKKNGLIEANKEKSEETKATKKEEKVDAKTKQKDKKVTNINLKKG